MQPAVPRVPQAVLFLAAAKAPKQLPVECQTPANLVKTKKSAFLAIFTQFCGNFRYFCEYTSARPKTTYQPVLP